MKRFIVSVLCISVFFIGLGALADNVGAKFKSDEKALDLIRKARLAIGGEAAIAEVRSMTIAGRTTHSSKVGGAERSESGETEIALQLPDKLMKMVKIGNMHAANVEKTVRKRQDVILLNKGETDAFILEDGNGEIITSDGSKKIIVKKHESTEGEIVGDGERKVFVRKLDGDKAASQTGDFEINDGDKRVVVNKVRGSDANSGLKQNELLRTTLALLLSAPQGMDVIYTFGGESSVDGSAVNIVIADFGGSNFKLFLGKTSNLPVMLSYIGHQMPMRVKFDAKVPAETKTGEHAFEFTRNPAAQGEQAEFQIRFSDYRSTGGIQLPYKWTTSVGGATSEVLDVTSYEINPSNIAEKFSNQKLMVRKAKPIDN